MRDPSDPDEIKIEIIGFESDEEFSEAVRSWDDTLCKNGHRQGDYVCTEACWE